MSDSLPSLLFVTDARVLHLRVLDAWSHLAQKGAEIAVEQALLLIHDNTKKDDDDDARRPGEGRPGRAGRQ